MPQNIRHKGADKRPGVAIGESIVHIVILSESESSAPSPGFVGPTRPPALPSDLRSIPLSHDPRGHPKVPDTHRIAMPTRRNKRKPMSPITSQAVVAIVRIEGGFEIKCIGGFTALDVTDPRRPRCGSRERRHLRAICATGYR